MKNDAIGASLLNVGLGRDVLLNEIAIQIQEWLDWQEKERKAEGLNIDDDVHIMSVPVWPSRGSLKAWVALLQTPNVKLRGPRSCGSP